MSDFRSWQCINMYSIDEVLCRLAAWDREVFWMRRKSREFFLISSYPLAEFCLIKMTKFLIKSSQMKRATSKQMWRCAFSRSRYQWRLWKFPSHSKPLLPFARESTRTICLLNTISYFPLCRASSVNSRFPFARWINQHMCRATQNWECSARYLTAWENSSRFDWKVMNQTRFSA